MNSEEYQKLDRLDRRHWFYRGKRAVVRHWIKRHLTLRADDLLVDAGCGTGIFLEEMAAQCRVLGLDDHAESIELARPRLTAVGGTVLQTSLEHIDLPDGCAAVATLLDVLEHVDDDNAVLREITRLVRPGGLVVITVPALRWLWSDWDVALHHRRRYHRADLRALCRIPGAEVLHCAYINSAALPAVALVRAWRKLRPPRPGAERAEDRVPHPILNHLLYHAMVSPACWRWFQPPGGVSLLMVLRRTAPVPRHARAGVLQASH
jgi:2-polyprenyl-3-methyl-5-hydroxy-6-metoxy-1,4-benzoquinol methylase